VPQGLLDLSAPLEAMVEFLRIDDDLLSAAAAQSVAEPDDTGALRAWAAALPVRTKDQWLRRAVDERREERERAEALRGEKARKAAEAARKKRLDALATRLDAAWSELESLVARSAYDEALKLALDLRDLAAREGTIAMFAETFEAMRKRQARRRGFFDRWKRETEPGRW
jgi:hypothetical protein